MTLHISLSPSSVLQHRSILLALTFSFLFSIHFFGISIYISIVLIFLSKSNRKSENRYYAIELCALLISTLLVVVAAVFHHGLVSKLLVGTTHNHPESFGKTQPVGLADSFSDPPQSASFVWFDCSLLG